MEGASVSCLTMLDSANYAYWKVKMITFIKAIDERVWRSILNDRDNLFIEESSVNNQKPKVQWTIEEERLESANSKTLNAIFHSVDGQEFKRVSRFKSAKEARDFKQLVKVQAQ